MEELPLEIWFLITEFFTDEDLYNVIGVNRFFFNLGMNKKYREVTLDTGDRKIRRWLVRVSDQGIASRIRRLILHIHPVNEPAPQEQSQRSLLDFLFLALDRVRHGTASNPSPKLEPLDVNGMIDKFVTVLPLMTGIEDFRIVTWALPPHYNLDQLYLTAWSIFGKNLRRISICANLGGYNIFPDDPAEYDILTVDLVPFVNALSPQIEGFKVRSFAKLDLSSLFLNMPPFTSLESTLIRIPFDSAVRRDPSGLRHFLLRSSETLKDVVIRLTPMGLALQPAAEEPVCEWLAECVADPGCFSNVKRLDICPTNLPAGIDILNRCISNSHRQMTEFRVRDRYLKTEEAVALSKTLSACPNLTTLHLNIFQLSHNVFDAFARDLPALRILQLWIGEPSSMVSTNTSTTLETFRKDMETRRYMDWKLWDLTIWESGHDLDSETMLTLMRSIPSLKSFGAKFED